MVKRNKYKVGEPKLKRERLKRVYISAKRSAECQRVIKALGG